MTGKQLKKLETELWKAADQLKANRRLEDVKVRKSCPSR